MGSPDRVSCFAGGGCQVVNLVGDMYPLVSCTLCHEMLWKVMDFENAFVRTGKITDFRENGRGHGKVIEFQFVVQMSHAVWKLETFSLSLSKKYAKKWLGFQHFLVMENWNWSWTTHGKVSYCPISVWTLSTLNQSFTNCKNRDYCKVSIYNLVCILCLCTAVWRISPSVLGRHCKSSPVATYRYAPWRTEESWLLSIYRKQSMWVWTLWDISCVRVMNEKPRFSWGHKRSLHTGTMLPQS